MIDTMINHLAIVLESNFEWQYFWPNNDTLFCVAESSALVGGISL